MPTSLREALDRLVEQARKDPQFFHGLVFEPELTLSKIDYLDRREKSMILGIAPEDVIAGLAGLIANPGGPVSECTKSCGNSCLDTCGGSCGRTCDSSCGSTCGSQSCGDTTKMESLGETAINPWRTQYGGARGFYRQMRRFDQ